ncbi:Uma2 family endonuclease [bacterium]|nr:Uma2 family endonuclease [bacterium]
MAMLIDRHKVWTYEDSLRLPVDGQRYEIIDGVLYVSPSPASRHQLLSLRLQFFFYQFQLEGKGFIFNAPMDLLMPGCSPVQPDLIFLQRDQGWMIKKSYIEGVPHLLAEILSPATRSLDRLKKLNCYAQNGVLFYLLVDPEIDSFEVLTLNNGRYHLESLSSEDSWEFQGQRLELGQYFAPLEVD